MDKMISLQHCLEMNTAMFFDFDGVFTDNRVIVSEDGCESVICNRSDFIGIARLKEVGVESIVVSAEKNQVVRERCKKLNIECFHGVSDKWQLVAEQISIRNLKPEQCGFMGNDIQDIECMKSVAFPVAVNDAYEEVLEVAKYVTKSRGGYGAVREICDLIYAAQK